MTDIPSCPLCEVAEVFSGFAFKSKDLGGNGLPVIKIGNINGGKVSPECSGHFPTEMMTTRLKRFFLHPSDTLIAMTGAGSVGRVGRMRNHSGDFLVNQRVGIVRPDKHRIDPEYLGYFLLQPKIEQHYYGLGVGAGQPNISPKQIGSTQIACPAISTQRCIASILSAYDDLIENNTHRIAVLEEMARRHYEEWFVHFRFPGHGEVRFQDNLPEGWEIKSLGDLVQDVRETIHPSQVPADTAYIGLEHIPRRSITLKEWSRADRVDSNKLRFQRSDILFGKIRPYFHKVCVAPIDGICSTDTILMRPIRQRFFALALCCAASDEFVDHATQTSNGTKMPRANWTVLKNYPVPVPVEDILSIFNEHVMGIVEQTRNLMFKNANLHTQRDLLLPKLISGEIDVSDTALPDGEEAAA